MGRVARPANVVDAVGRLRRGRGPIDLVDEARRWAERTCGEQGLPVTITDAVTVARVAAVLREVSDAPDRLHARRVKAVEAANRGPDDHAVQDSGDDGSALVEVEVGPLAS